MTTENITEDVKIETPAEEVKQEEKLKLPRVEAPIMNFDKDTKMFWVGIPADKVAPFEGVLMLDAMKMNYVQAFSLVKQSMATAKILTPTGMDKARMATQSMKNFLFKNKKV